MKRIVILSVGVLFVFYSGSLASASSNLNVKVFAPPTPVDTVIHFPDLKAAWTAGGKLDPSQLLGTWKEVGQAATETCASVADDRYDSSGLKNNDGSARELVFDMFQPPDLNGKKQKVLGVSFLGLGQAGNNQGPFQFDPNEPQFAQWAYSSTTGEMSRELYFEYSCRSYGNIMTKLVCGVAPRLIQRHSPNWSQGIRDCIGNGSLGIMKLYIM